MFVETTQSSNGTAPVAEIRHVEPVVEPIADPVLTGGEIVVRCLEEENVEFVFGHPGGAVIHIYDAMAQRDVSFEHVLVRHEQAGTHAAEGYAKATGKVGTVLVTSGPGATNCVTGIADAFMDSVPIVVFTGQVPTAMIGGDAFQETDIIGVTRSITKHSFQVRRASDLAPTIKAAYHIARTGRPGPVVVDLPKDVLGARAPFRYPETVDIPGYAVPGAPDAEQLRCAADMIAQAERPLLYVGGGVISSGATEELTALARSTRIPVTTTLHGLGSFPESDPLSLGMLGMHGAYCANRAVQACDLLIAVGARFDDRVTGKLDAWAPHAKIVHLDIDPSSLSKHIPAECAVLGDARASLEGLLALVAPTQTQAWHAEIDAWKQECPTAYETDGKLRAQHVFKRLSDRTGGEAVVVTDVGQHQMWAAQFFQYARTRSHITSGGLGTMGFSLPAAMGAAFGLAGTGVPVISISGDGGFAMNAQELGVLAQYKLPVKIIVINNGKLGMVGQLQTISFESRFSHIDLTPSNPDFVALAEAFGVRGLRCSTPEELEATLDEAWGIDDAPVLIECVVEPEELVFPMVPGGASNSDMITARFATS